MTPQMLQKDESGPDTRSVESCGAFTRKQKKPGT